MKTLKKITAFSLALIMIAVLIPFTALAAETTEQKGYIFETNVNIRKDATTSSEILDNVSNLNVTVLGSKKDTKGTKMPGTSTVYLWYNISYKKDSKTIKGYVREDLIKLIVPAEEYDFNKEIKKFPESYQTAIKSLHKSFPNWKLVADPVDMTFNEAVNAEDEEFTKITFANSKNSWRSMRKGCYNWEKQKFLTSDGGRYGASRELIAYYMDPRNFLTENGVFIFMQQSYDSKTQTVEGIEKILKGTFLDAKITNKKDKYYGKRYAAVIRYAGSKSGVNAYVLATTIIQEQGNKGSVYSNGSLTYSKKTVYNFFNFGASGETRDDIVTNAAKTAYNNSWFTETDSIVGGAKKYGANYIAVGQDTYFYKDYNIINPAKIWHQYAQNVEDAENNAKILVQRLSQAKTLPLTFRIPVYKSIPTKVSALPPKNDNYNNYYFEKLSVNGLTPAFNRYTTSYTLDVSDSEVVTYDLPDGATYAGENSYDLVKGKNKISLKVKSQSGYTRTYTLTVTAQKAAKLTLMGSGGTLVKDETDKKWYYYENGEKSPVTTIVKYSGKWFYVKDGVWDKTVTSLVKYNGTWFYIKSGKWNDTAKTLVKYSGKWFYVEKGKWNKSAKTLVKYSGKWFYVEKGKWDKTAKTIVKYSGKRFYVKKGKVDLTYSGTVKIDGIKYKIKNGKVV